jgi:hypothetical protein
MAPGSVGVALQNINVACSADWSFRLHIWPHTPSGSGSATVAVSSTTASATVGIAVSPDGHPIISAENVALNIGSISIHFSDSLWDWLLNLLKSLFSGAIKRAVTKAFDNAVSSLLNDKINTRIANISLQFPLNLRAPYNIAEVRFGLTDAPAINTTYLGLPLQGDIVSAANPVNPPITPPALPWFDASSGSRYAQIHLSEYTILSGIYTFYSAGLMTWTVTPDRIPLGLNNTGGYGLIAPLMPSQFPNAPVGIALSCQSMPTVNITEGGMSVQVPLAAAFVVDPTGKDTTAFTLGLNAALSINVTVGPNSNGVIAIQGALNFIDAPLSTLNSAVGPITLPLLNGLIQYIFNSIIVPVVNDVLGPGIPLPNLGTLAQLTNTELRLNDGYLLVATDFKLNITTAAHPKLPMRVRDSDAFLSFMRQHAAMEGVGSSAVVRGENIDLVQWEQLVKAGAAAAAESESAPAQHRGKRHTGLRAGK